MVWISCGRMESGGGMRGLFASRCRVCFGPGIIYPSWLLVNIPAVLAINSSILAGARLTSSLTGQLGLLHPMQAGASLASRACRGRAEIMRGSRQWQGLGDGGSPRSRAGHRILFPALPVARCKAKSKLLHFLVPRFLHLHKHSQLQRRPLSGLIQLTVVWGTTASSNTVY